MKIKDIGEFGLIDLLARQVPAPSDRVVKGIGDDTAVIRPEQGKLVLMTTDMIIEDVHFSLRYTPLRAVGWKALAVNISDIAAMGGTPAYAVVAVGIPPNMEAGMIEELYSGLGECARIYQTDIVGGDTVRSPGGLIINVALSGWVEPNRVVYRSGACPGDIFMVSGPLGTSAAGLYALNSSCPVVTCDAADEVIQAHLRPWARVKEGLVLGRSGYVTSMNDISDGLASEVLEICRASGTGCELYADSIPYTGAVAEICRGIGVPPLEWALYGGEDYELVFTVKPEGADFVKAALHEAGCSPEIVGKVVLPDEGCIIVENHRRAALTPGGYDHFRE